MVSLAMETIGIILKLCVCVCECVGLGGLKVHGNCENARDKLGKYENSKIFPTWTLFNIGKTFKNPQHITFSTRIAGILNCLQTI